MVDDVGQRLRLVRRPVGPREMLRCFHSACGCMEPTKELWLLRGKLAGGLHESGGDVDDGSGCAM